MNTKITGLFFMIFIVVGISTSAQVIDNTSTFKTIPSESYFRFQYDNDYFTKEDRYYTQGISFEYVHPGLRRFPLTKLLLRTSNSSNIYGIGLNVFGYTPTSILSSDILYGDRPYASIISIKTFSASTDTVNHKRISSAINIGVIGPAALGDEIQTGIHSWIKNPLPKGWHNQVQNDVVLNYQVNYEKELLSAPGHFLLNGMGELRAGTLDDKLSAGFNLMAGNFNDPYRIRNKKKKIGYYFYMQSNLQLVGYNASLQGGIFNRHDPYSISSKDIERLLFEADAGIAVNFKKLYLSYSQAFISREFNTANIIAGAGLISVLIFRAYNSGVFCFKVEFSDLFIFFHINFSNLS